MARLDVVGLTILFGAALVLASILSSLVALRFGVSLLLMEFLVVGSTDAAGRPRSDCDLPNLILFRPCRGLH